MAEASKLTPQQRLALSRRALLQELQGEWAVDPPPQEQSSHSDRPHRSDARGDAFGGAFASISWAPMARSLAARWWRRHPLNAVGQLAHPLLQRYAHEQPAKLMAIAAATGAVVVLVRPWRLLSAAALLGAALKSSDIADIVTSLMQAPKSGRKHRR